MNQTNRVWIAQCLCPQRHAILASAWEAEAENWQEAEDAVLEPLRAKVTELLATRTINPWCGLCRSPKETWTYELNRTAFSSMQEAEPALRQSEREQAALRRASGR